VIAVVIQARMGSSRLPGKVMKPLAGKPIIDHVVERAHAAMLPNYVIVAVPDTTENDALAAHCAALHNVTVVRGPEDDVLRRFTIAAMAVPEADLFVRLTADDPFKDPALIDQAITAYLHAWAEPEPEVGSPAILHLGGLTWAYGMDVEVFSRQILMATAANATTPYDREHVTPFMREAWGVWTLKDTEARSTINTRLTVDTPDDFAAAERIMARVTGLDYAATLAAL